MYRIALVFLLVTGCVTQADDGPSEEEITDVDAWADASGGKADLPATWSELVAWLKDTYRNRLSAVWHNQEHPASATAAVARVRALVAAAGKSPEGSLYRMSVRRLRFSDMADHSEINITLPGGKVIRLIGDPKGAGVFVDSKAFQEALSPSLCLTWSELQTAIEASYVSGHYGVDFVCHNVTERVLRALHIGSSKFSAQVHAFSIARYVWGPVLPSGNSSNPADWAESRSCPN